MILVFLEVSLWVFLVGLVVGEFYLLVVQRRKLWMRIAFSVIVLLACVAGWYLLEPPSPAQAMQAGRFALLVVTMTGVPLAVFLSGVHLAARFRVAILPHLLLILGAAGIAAIWPLSVISVGCQFGLGCF